MSDEAPVVHLVTHAEREAEAIRDYESDANREAIAMLQRALVRAAEAKPGEARMVGVVIAYAFDDHSFGSIIPMGAQGIGTLLGAVTDAQYRILASLNRDDL